MTPEERERYTATLALQGWVPIAAIVGWVGIWNDGLKLGFIARIPPGEHMWEVRRIQLLLPEWHDMPWHRVHEALDAIDTRLGAT